MAVKTIEVPGNKLRAKRGFAFRKVPGGVSVLNKKIGKAAARITVNCKCSKGSGCKITIVGNTVFCSDSGCQGSCTMITEVPTFQLLRNLGVLL